ALINGRDSRFVEFKAIPKLAGNRSMRLIKRFTIVSVSAAPYLITAPELHFNKPVGVGKRLASEPGDIRLTLLQYRLGLFESCNTSSCHDRRIESRRIYRALYCGYQRHAATEWAGSI